MGSIISRCVSQKYRPLVVAAVSAILSYVASYVVFRMYQRLSIGNSTAASRLQSSSSSYSRYVIKLSTSCSLDDRLAAKRLAAATLGGKGAIAAIEEGAAPLATLFVIDTKHKHFMHHKFLVELEKQRRSSSGGQNQQKKNSTDASGLLKPEDFGIGADDEFLMSEVVRGGSGGGGGDDTLFSPVVALVVVKPGWQDIEFESAVHEASLLLKDERYTRQQVLEQVGKRCSLLGEEIVPIIVATALGENMSIVNKTDDGDDGSVKSATDDDSSSRATKNPSCRRRPKVVAAEINSLAVDPAHRGLRLGMTLANVAGALICTWGEGVIEVQGNAASKDLVPYYFKMAGHDDSSLLREKVVERDQFFVLPLTEQSVRKELAMRALERLPAHVMLDEELLIALTKSTE